MQLYCKKCNTQVTKDIVKIKYADDEKYYNVEIIDRELMGVAVLTLNAPLNQAELIKIKETIEGQSSDGFGEGLEQHEIKCNGKEIYVSLWNSNDWSLKTAEEMGILEQKNEMKFGGM